jgi:hypothetical protein
MIKTITTGVRKDWITPIASVNRHAFSAFLRGSNSCPSFMLPQYFRSDKSAIRQLRGNSG